MAASKHERHTDQDYGKAVEHHQSPMGAFAEQPRSPIADCKKLLATAERDAAFIEREKMPWGNGLALLVRTGVAAFRAGTAKEAIRLLTIAATSAAKA